MKKLLVYVMGPSGSGKDSTMKWVMQNKDSDLNLRWVKRCVTRELNDHESTDHYITNERFDHLLSNDLLAMNWQAHSIRYGIERSELVFTDQSELILINGSRAYYSVAKRLYPDLLAIHITANLDILEKRLLGRARESAEAIGLRLERARHFPLDPNESILEVINDGNLDESGRIVLDHLYKLIN